MSGWTPAGQFTLTFEATTRDDKPVVAARLRVLGLTAYGDTKTEALTHLAHMLTSAIAAHEEDGEAWLGRALVEGGAV